MTSSFVLAINPATFAVRSAGPVARRGAFIAVLTGHVSSLVRASVPPVDRLLDAYAAWGPALAAHLDGQYAAVIIDRAARRICLVQDALGLRTLFHTTQRGELIAAARLDDLVALITDDRLDEHYFAGQFARGARPRGRTPFAAIGRLDHGTTLVVAAGRRDEVRPWRPPNTRPETSADVAPRLRALVDDAVRSMLPATGRTACELSGGLDSTTVLATAARFDPTVAGLSIVRAGGDDERYSRDAADFLRVPRYTIDADRYPHFSILPDRFVGEPGGELHVAMRRAYDAIVIDKGVDVILTGEPGDIAFGYGGVAPAHLADPLARGRPGAAFAAVRAWAAHADAGRPWTHVFVHHSLRPAWRHWRRQSLITAAHLPPAWVMPALLARTGVGDAPWPQLAPRVERPGAQYLWESVYAMAAEATDATRLNAPGEVRHPLFYRPLLEFLFGLDPALRSGIAGDRVLQRAALADRLPPTVALRTTKGSGQCAREQALLANPAWYAWLTDRPRLVDRGWVDAAAWRRQIDRARLGLYGQRPHLDFAMLTEFWLRTIETHRPTIPILRSADEAPEPSR